MSTADNKRRGTSIEQELECLLRSKGDLMPVTVEQVALAEARHSLENVPSHAKIPEVPRQLSVAQTSVFAEKRYWTHSSVLTLDAADPIEAITQKARELVLNAMELGWAGPPYDPSQLADLLGIRLLPTDRVIDAQTRSVGSKFQIEFNPLRPPARLRFSLAHEIAHTLFPDCAHAVRHRATHQEMSGDDWQLEMLCNIAASEILMPIGSLPKMIDEFEPSVDSILRFRRVFQVSAEAVLLRLMRLTTYSCFGFAAHRDPATNRYRLDYAVTSSGFRSVLPMRPGFALPKETFATECTAIGYTAKGRERWSGLGDLELEYVGVPSYPGHTFPRVLGVVKPSKLLKTGPQIRFLKGDASEPRGHGVKILCQLVSDKALTWGAGFARVVRTKWPRAQREFTDWVVNSRRDFRLGAVKLTHISDNLLLASLVAQHGYGETSKPRIRYAALEQCLRSLADAATRNRATVHMPRIGTGQAGGSWTVVQEIIQQTLCHAGIDVTIYELPNQPRPAVKQPNLFDLPTEEDQIV